MNEMNEQRGQSLHEQHFDVFLPTFSRVIKVSILQLRHSPFFTWFVLRFTSFSLVEQPCQAGGLCNPN